jgi:hypothetical protein
MSSNLSLLVPMNVTALCVGKKDVSSGSKFGKIAAEFQNLDTKPYLGSSVVPRPFDEEAALPGIHLHWALPDALTRSDPNDGNQFPRVPNRFLVVRIAAVAQTPGGTPVELERTAWAVESDYLWKEEDKNLRERDPRNAVSRAVPVQYLGKGSGDQARSSIFAYQGRVRSLEPGKPQVVEDSKRDNSQRLTAIGYGTEAYAAAYPNCRNVFGFFDPPFDAANAQDGLQEKHKHVSYLVIGWYSDPLGDPIKLMEKSGTPQKLYTAMRKDPARWKAGLATEDYLRKEAFANAFQEDYHWTYNWHEAEEDRAKHARRPEQTLFVGQVNGLEWTSDKEYLTPNTHAIKVALGTTTAEALSALIASENGIESPKALETLLNDFQFDLLRDYGTAAGQANLLDTLHQRDFTPVPAGHAGEISAFLFVESDFMDVESLLHKLRTEGTSLPEQVSGFLWKAVQKAPFFGNAHAPLQEKRIALVHLFNHILKDGPIYDQKRFVRVRLRPETLSLIAQNPTGESLIRLNQMLIVDAYPNLISTPESGRGRIWLIKQTATGEPAARTGELVDAAKGMGFTLPDELRNALNTLNLLQSAYDDLAAAVATRRAQIFADWTKYLASKDDASKSYINKEIEALKGLVSERNTKDRERDRAKGKLKGLLRLQKYVRTPQSGLAPAIYEYVLDSVTAPRYYQPNDPVILLSGVDPSTRYGGGGNLACRLSDEISTAQPKGHAPTLSRVQLDTFCARESWATILPVEFSGREGSIARPQPRRDPIRGNIMSTTTDLREDLISLCVEACLLHPSMSKLIGSTAFAQKQKDYIESRDTSTFKGVAPSRVGFTEHMQPWIPLVLQWEASFNPFHPLRGPHQTHTSYPEMWGLQKFQLSPSNPEITHTGENPGLSGAVPATYRGTATLAHNVQQNLMTEIDRYLKDHPLVPDKDTVDLQKMKRELQRISTMPLKMMAQSLDGFHRQLLMRDQSLQMRVVAPPPPGILKDPDLVHRYIQDSEFGVEVSKAVLNECDASCLDDRNNYNPLRGGILKIRRLRVLDAFGQIRDIINPNRPLGVLQSSDVILSSRLKKAPEEWKETGAVLPPRFAQPARLSFRYRSAGSATSNQIGAPDSTTLSEMNSGPDSSPIFGWVLYNRFDHALAIYDQDGRTVGSFNLLGPPWQDTPGAYKGVANPHLLEFLQHLGGQVRANRGGPDYTQSRAFLSKLIDTIDHVSAGIEPDGFKQDQGVAMLIGRPLALVLADLRLDLYGTIPDGRGLPGMPAIDQSREAFDAVKSAPGYVEKDRPSADLAKVRFPVRLGDDGKVHDGLVGYFVRGYFVRGEDATSTYKTFYAVRATDGEDPGVLTPPLTGIERLSLAPSDPLPKTVVMLVDPRAAVHASTGILPVKSIALPPALYAEALKRIGTTFLTAPVLGGADRVSLPVPNVDGHAWSWLTRQSDERFGVPLRKWTTQDVVVSPNSRAAFSAAPLRISEGWLHLFPVQPSSDSGQNKSVVAPAPNDILVKPDASGVLMLAPETAGLHGTRLALAETDEGHRFVSFWDHPMEFVVWRTRIPAGKWRFYLYKQSIGLSEADDADSQIEIAVTDSSAALVASVQRTLTRGPIHTPFDFAINLPGEYKVSVKLLRGAFNLAKARMEPITSAISH